MVKKECDPAMEAVSASSCTSSLTLPLRIFVMEQFAALTLAGPGHVICWKWWQEEGSWQI